MKVMQMIETAFTRWLNQYINQIVKQRIKPIMVLVSEVQAKIADLEALVLQERAQVSAAIDEYAKKLKDALEAAQASSGQDLSVLIADLQRVEDEVRSMYEPPSAPPSEPPSAPPVA